MKTKSLYTITISSYATEFLSQFEHAHLRKSIRLQCKINS
jgi:hypothetical protein